MNNTMKLALGVTGFASLLVLAVPSNFKVENQKAAQSPPITALVTPSKTTNIPAPAIVKQEADDNEDENFSFGDPIANAEPFNEEVYQKEEIISDIVNTAQSDVNRQLAAASSNNRKSAPSNNSKAQRNQENPFNQGTTTVISRSSAAELRPVN